MTDDKNLGIILKLVGTLLVLALIGAFATVINAALTAGH